MDKIQKIEINNKEYILLDTKEKITVPDCVVWSTNKVWSASWESKIYLGQENKETFDFFWNRGFKIQCVIKKIDLLKYLDDVKDEYFNPQLPYGVAYTERQNKKRVTKKNPPNMSDLWKDRKKEVEKLDDYIYFEFYDQPQIDPPRVYVNTDSEVVKLLRKLALPSITYLSAIKLKKDEGNLYYFRLFVDYFDDSDHPYILEKEEKKIMDDNSIHDDEKKQVIKARKWQWKYRKWLLEECPFCPITLISDDRLLIASHIKPWSKSEINEKTDPKNGFMFTPTYDLLFDRGFITFTNEQKVLISPWLSKMTCSKLNISPNKKYPMLNMDGREKYLEYHREYIFKS